MSAITVNYNLDGKPIQEADVRTPLDVLSHRGADRVGVWTKGGVGFGCRMRCTTPEAVNERLPAVSARSGCVITGDVRIDNRKELIDQLFPEGKERDITDCEIVLRGYEEWGDECLPKFLGDFAFAIWDPNKRRLLCARDSMGVKHFYYYHRPGKLFALASEAKALTAQPDIPNEINDAHVGDVLMLNYHDKESTMFRDIYRLPANNALVVDQDGIRIWQYWRPKHRRPSRFRSNRYYEEQFREIFTEAVECRLRSTGKPGTLLSGGLDSSSISAVAARHLKDIGAPPLETFSAVFPTVAEIDSGIDEREFIEEVEEYISCSGNAVIADDFGPLLDLDAMQSHADHLLGAPNVFMDWALFKAARKKGIQVLLSGYDGDSAVSYGYEGLEQMARRGNWIRLFRDAFALRRNMPGKYHSPKRLIWKEGFREAVPERAKQTWRLLNGRPRDLVPRQELPYSVSFNYEAINPEFANELDLKRRYFEIIEKNYPPDHSEEESKWNALCCGLFAFGLESFEKLGAVFEIEQRFPFFDRRLIDYCIGLPPTERLRDGWTRSIFRRSMRDIIPEAVQWRITKANLGISYKINLLKYDHELVRRLITDAPKEFDRFLDRNSLLEALERFETDPVKHESEAMLLNSAVSLSNWLSRV